MTFETVDHVKYFLQNNKYYIVGDNSTNDANGITNQSYYGEIVIPEKIKNKEILEIGQYAFRNCSSITRVTIFAKLTAIHLWAFEYCENIAYINIPRTVTFIGEFALALSTDNEDDSRSYVPLTVEFCKGRTKDIFIGEDGISYRNSISIIYQSSIEPIFGPDEQFVEVGSAKICAYKTFVFYFYDTTEDMTQCPAPIFEILKSAAAAASRFTCKRKTGSSILLISIFILISALPFISKRVVSNKKIE